MEEKMTMDELAKFCKRKGFVFPSADIYGGFAGFWDFGHNGSELKRNIKDSWWNFHVRGREDVVGIDGSVITNPKVWEASGHVDSFVDVAVECVKCAHRFKVDRHELEGAVCEKCGGDVQSKGEFNPMFVTNVGPIKEDSVKSYLRPETAQLIFSNFKHVSENSRCKLPFGIAQMGKAFRNEIAPRNFLFRTREFEQMELEYFVDPEDKEKCPYDIFDIQVKVYSKKMQEEGEEPSSMKIADALDKGIIKLSWHAYWLAYELKWFESLGANLDNFRLRQHLDDEKSHYASDTWDIEYDFLFGYRELQGIADRGSYDLKSHEKGSGKSLSVMDDVKGKKVLPMVISEPSLGVERAFLVFLSDALRKNDKGDIVLGLHPSLAPVKAAVLPLVKKDEELVKKAREVYDSLKGDYNVVYDESGSVGRRYARNDEIGTPYCIVTDSTTLEDSSVTIRERDSAVQKRVMIKDVYDVLSKLVGGRMSFDEL